MNLAWIGTPWAIVVALTAFRLTRLWVEDMLPPLPRLRDGLLGWAADRDAARLNAAIAADRDDPDFQRALDERARAAFASGLPAPYLAGPHEEDELDRQGTAGGPPVSYLVTCYWCAGFWISLAVLLVAVFVPLDWWALPYGALALSALVALLAKITE